MSHTPNELAEQFAQDAEVLHRLKLSNPHFVELADSYHALNRTIHRIEIEAEPASDEHTEELKKQRLALLDEIGAMIAEEKGATV